MRHEKSKNKNTMKDNARAPERTIGASTTPFLKLSDVRWSVLCLFVGRGVGEGLVEVFRRIITGRFRVAKITGCGLRARFGIMSLLSCVSYIESSLKGHYLLGRWLTTSQTFYDEPCMKGTKEI